MTYWLLADVDDRRSVVLLLPDSPDKGRDWVYHITNVVYRYTIHPFVKDRDCCTRMEDTKEIYLGVQTKGS